MMSLFLSLNIKRIIGENQGIKKKNMYSIIIFIEKYNMSILQTQI
jgi:hypothetical protein